MPGSAHVLHVGDAAGDLAGNVEARDRLADDLVGRGRLRRALAGRLAVEIGRAGELAIGDLAAVGAPMTPSVTVSVIRCDAELLRGEVEQHGAHLGAGEAQRRAAVLDRLAAGGLTLRSASGAVSPEIIVTRASGRSSSSAAICASAVRMPCPSSTLPVKTVAVPSALMRIQASSMRLSVEAAGQRRRLLRQRQRFGRIEREGEHDAAEARR